MVGLRSMSKLGLLREELVEHGSIRRCERVDGPAELMALLLVYCGNILRTAAKSR